MVIEKLAYVIAVATLLSGCNNNASGSYNAPVSAVSETVPTVSEIAPSTDTENLSEGKPPAWDMVTDVCPTFDEDKLYHLIYMQGYDKDEVIEAETNLCFDGQEYCYAIDSLPIVKPEADAGWECRYVQKLPSSHAIPDTYYIDTETAGYWYAADAQRKLRTPIRGSIMAAWVCIDEQCTCGQTTCPQNSLCIDNACYCNDQLYKEGACELDWVIQHEPGWDPNMEMIVSPDETDALAMYQRDGHYYTSCTDSQRHALKDPDECDIEEGYHLYCDKTPITDTTIQNCIRLSDGTHVVFYTETDDDLSELYYITPYTYDDIKAERNTNKTNPAFRCGKETCVKGEICYKNHCAGLGTQKALPSADYRWNAFMPECIAESGCTCAKQKCRKGQFCMEGECRDAPYALKRHGKWTRYGVVGNSAFYADNDEMEDDDEAPEEENGASKPTAFIPDSTISPPNMALWFDILTHTDSQTCDATTEPSNVEDYICLYSAPDDERLEAPQITVTGRGFHCIRPEGCACGDALCPMHAQCIDGACSYDAIYLHEACHRENILQSAQNYRTRNRFVDARGWCYCGESLVPPSLPGYQCTEIAGMQCMLPQGCPCGDVTCADEETCLAPGNCKKL